MIARAERAGLGLSLAGHVALFGALSIGLFAASRPLVPPSAPVEVSLVAPVALRDATPTPAESEPAPSVAPEVAPPMPTPMVQPAPAPAPREAVAPPKPAAVAPPKPSPAARPKPVQPKPAAARPAPTAPARPKLALNLSGSNSAKPRGARLGRDFLQGISDRPSTATAQTPHAPAGPAVEAALAREVLRQLKPHWHAPTGADAEQLRTTLSIHLGRDGSVTDVRVLATTGVTDSNRGQVAVHREAAVKAVRLAAPFVLPADLYDAWAVLEPVGFDKRLSQ